MKWASTYTPPGRFPTVIHAGGPADGLRCVLEHPIPPAVRFYATRADRAGPRVILARYVMYQPVEISVYEYRYTGTEERRGPLPGPGPDGVWS